MPTGGAAATGQAGQGAHELVGIIATSSQTLVGITQTATKRSIWIPVGKTVEGIEVVSCDPKQDRAVIRVGGETKTLALRAATVTSAPASGPAAVATLPALAKPGTQAEQEREARMLVSDLMEIGMQQRKAYEEAQRKAAQQKAAEKK
ncbi:hypothetical protein DB347_14735 [Opitutaceae bacterium EW11]|nr:hypothetical protein DB347_14735 [Opitutaceae bacterium EW11]